MKTPIMVDYDEYIKSNHLAAYSLALANSDFATACSIARDCIEWLSRYDPREVMIRDNVSPITVGYMRDMLARKLLTWAYLE